MAVPTATVPAVAANAANSAAPSAVEDGAYPDSARLLQQTGVTLTAGDGHITLTDCTSDYQVKVFTGLAQAQPGSTVCFKTTGTSGYLALSVPEVFAIGTYADRSLTAQISVGGTTSSVSVGANKTVPVGESAPGGTGVATLLELRVTAPAGTPATTPTDPATAFNTKLTIGDKGRSCSGALVDPLWVITAKSCFADNPASSIDVASGAPKLATTAIVGRTDLNATGGSSVAVAELVPAANRDVVMARLASPVTGITPLAIGGTAPLQGEELQVAGYGRTRTAWTNDKLHTAAFSVSSDVTTGFDITPKTPADATACKGDTGGAVWHAENGKPALVAVTSRAWQGGCLGTDATETRAGAYSARTDDLAGWVQDVRYRTIEIKPGTHLFAIGSEGSTYGLDVNYATGVWGSSWKRLDGTNLKAITSVTTGNTVHLYAVAADGHVYNRDGVTGGYWSSWQEVPGGLSGAKAITASVTEGTKVHIQVIGADGMYNQDANYTAGTTWSVWTKMDSTNLKTITSAVTGNTAHIYAVNEDNKVYTRDANYSVGWTNWVEIPGALTGAKAITASVTEGTKVHIQVIGADGMYNQDANYTAGTWSVWTKMDSTNLKTITSTVTGNTAHIYAVNEDNKLYVRDANYSVGWGSWAEVPGGAAGLKGITATTSG
ncbi:trypsin-like serine protease [Kitasatospora sp. NPDC001664]